MDDKSFGGWPTDLTRALIVWILCAAGGYFAFDTGIFTLPGLSLFLLTLFLGPFIAARFACHLIPADRPLAPTLSWGFLLGFIFFLILGLGLRKIGEQRQPRSDYTPICVALIAGGPLLGAVTFSRLKRWNS
ncbi:MAG TPA: hypothetical protein VI216_02415 [Candidatus Acidoferrales bacterium]